MAVLEYFIISLVSLGGFLREPWWVILVGTLAMCAGNFMDKWEMLYGHPSVPFDWQIGG